VSKHKAPPVKSTRRRATIPAARAGRCPRPSPAHQTEKRSPPRKPQRCYFSTSGDILCERSTTVPKAQSKRPTTAAATHTAPGQPTPERIQIGSPWPKLEGSGSRRPRAKYPRTSTFQSTNLRAKPRSLGSPTSRGSVRFPPPESTRFTTRTPLRPRIARAGCPPRAPQVQTPQCA